MPTLRLSSRSAINYLAYALIGVALLLTLLPQVISHGLVYGLGRIGAGAVNVGNVDINLFSGRLALDEVAIYQSGARVLYLGHAEVEVDWHTLWQHRLQLRKLLLQNLSVTVQQSTGGDLSIAGLNLPPDSADSGEPTHKASTPAWGVGLLDLSLQNVTLDYIRPGLSRSLTVKHLTAGPLQSWVADKPTPLKAQLALSDATLDIDASVSPFAAERTTTSTLKLKAFQLNTLAPLLPADINELKGTLSSELKIDFKQSGDKLQLAQSGTLNVTKLRLSVPNNHLSVSTQKLNWQGSAGLAMKGNHSTVSADGNLGMATIAIGQTGETAPHTTLAEFKLSDIKLKTLKDIRVGEASASGLHTSLELTPSGFYPLQYHQAKSTGGETRRPATTEAASEPLHLRIDRTVIDGDNRIRFEDRTTSPAFQQQLTVNRITLGELDNSQPALTSPFTLEAKLGEHSTLTAEGSVAAFSKPLKLKVSSKLNGYEMPPLSPYLVRQLGYKINNGQLDSQLQLSIADNTMDGEVKLTARQLDMEAESPERIKEFEQRSNMPIGTALGLLRDDDNNIKLTIPLSGNLNDPQFDFSDAINTALANTLRSGAVSYLKYLLQPYSSVITLVQLAGKAGGGVQLEPISFEPASLKPDPKMEEYVGKLAALFNKRDNLQLRLCGIATQSDLVALSKGERKTIPPEGEPELEKLARSRAENIKTILVEQYGIDPARLFICHPELENDEKAAPRVRVQL